MGNLVGKITTDAGPLEDEINCDCNRSPIQVYSFTSGIVCGLSGWLPGNRDRLWPFSS